MVMCHSNHLISKKVISAIFNIFYGVLLLAGIIGVVMGLYSIITKLISLFLILFCSSSIGL